MTTTAVQSGPRTVCGALVRARRITSPNRFSASSDFQKSIMSPPAFGTTLVRSVQASGAFWPPGAALTVSRRFLRAFQEILGQVPVADGGRDRRVLHDLEELFPTEPAHGASRRRAGEPLVLRPAGHPNPRSPAPYPPRGTPPSPAPAARGGPAPGRGAAGTPPRRASQPRVARGLPRAADRG